MLFLFSYNITRTFEAKKLIEKTGERYMSNTHIHTHKRKWRRKNDHKNCDFNFYLLPSSKKTPLFYIAWKLNIALKFGFGFFFRHKIYVLLKMNFRWKYFRKFDRTKIIRYPNITFLQSKILNIVDISCTGSNVTHIIYCSEIHCFQLLANTDLRCECML